MSIYEVAPDLLAARPRNGRRVASSADGGTKPRCPVIWLCGLSGAGKTTLAEGLKRHLGGLAHPVCFLDGDRLRKGLSRELGFCDRDRRENVRRAAEVAKLLADTGIITISALITPTDSLREMVRTIVSPGDFVLVYVKASLAACAKRDPKGLYSEVRKGRIHRFTGLDSPFDAPADADLVLDTEREDIASSCRRLVEFVLPRLQGSR